MASKDPEEPNYGDMLKKMLGIDPHAIISGDINEVKDANNVDTSTSTTPSPIDGVNATRGAKGGEVKKDEIKPPDEEMQGIHKYDPTAELNPGKYMGEFNVNASTKNYAGGGDVKPTFDPKMAALLAMQGPQMPPAPMGDPNFAVSGGASAPAVNLPPQTTGPSLSMPSASNNYSMLTPQSPTPPPSPDQPALTQMNADMMNGAGGPTQQPPTPPPQPSLSDTTQALNKTPDTNYDFYKGMSSQDRADLYSQLSQQQKGPGSLIPQALGGVGDAISALGGQKSNFLGNIQGQQEQRKQGAMGAFDTQRAQKMQDLQARMTMMESDPQSPMSAGYRQMIYALTGKRAPSNVSAAQLKGVFPDYTKIFEAEAQRSTAAGAQGIEAGKTVADRGMIGRVVDQMFGNQGMDYLKSRSGGTPTTQAPSVAPGWSVKR